MSARRLALLAVITVAVAIGAAVTAHYRAPQTAKEKELFLPELGARVNDVAELRLEGKGKVITLTRNGDRWGIAEADGYPALFDKVKPVIVGAAALRVVDAKTSNPELWPRLGVEDPATRGANSTLITMKDAAGGTVAELIAGQDRKSSSPGDQPGLYVRLPGEDAAWLVEGRLDVSMEIPDWLDRDIFSIAGDRIRSVEIMHGGGPALRLERAQQHGELKLIDPPAGNPPPSQVVVDRMATLLENMFIDGARALSNVTFSDAATQTVVRTFDGLVARISAEEIDGRPLASFRFEAAPDMPAAADASPAADAGAGSDDGAEPEAHDPAAEAAELNARTDGWAYVVPRFKFELLIRKPADFSPAADGADDPAAG